MSQLSTKTQNPGKKLKSKTGCQTCRYQISARHIKCDESKPICLRCQTKGWKCEGYYPSSIHTSSNPSQLLSYTLLNLSQKDTRALSYFKSKTLTGLMGFNSSSDFWSGTLLQFAEISPAVLRAVLALSARHEDLYINPPNPKSNSHSKLETEGSLHAVRQYNKSIRQLSKTTQPQKIHFTLTCCILFICLENLSGNHEVALSHLENGLKILKEWHSQPLVSETEKITREQITAVFTRLDMQATVFLDSRQPEMDMNFISRSGSSCDNQAGSSIFNSLQEAQIALESIEIRLLHILTASPSPTYPGWTSPNASLDTRNQLLSNLANEFTEWKRCFDDLAQRQNANMPRKDLLLSLLLVLHHQTTSLMLSEKYNLALRPRPGPKLDYTTRYRQINNVAKSLIMATAGREMDASFSADLGVIAPLYFVAMNCADLGVRRDAIGLLGGVRGKEGFWNAETVMGIAEGVLGGVEGQVVDGGIPVLAWEYGVVCF